MRPSSPTVMLYAELRPMRIRQVVRDVAALAACAVAVRVGVAVHRLVMAASGPGAAISDAGEAIGGVPGLRGVGAALVDAGRAQQDLVGTLALWLGGGLAVAGVALVLLVHLPGRLAWVRDAATAAGLRGSPGDLQLLAYRAVARRPLSRLRAAVPDPGPALARGDYLPFAALELRELGLRPPG